MIAALITYQSFRHLFIAYMDPRKPGPLQGELTHEFPFSFKTKSTNMDPNIFKHKGNTIIDQDVNVRQ